MEWHYNSKKLKNDQFPVILKSGRRYAEFKWNMSEYLCVS